MTPQERDLILSVAQRLRGTPLTDKDHEAERLIQTDIGSQPDALYRLTQAVIVQEQGLRHAQERIQQLEAELQAAQQARPSGFLSSLFGGGSSPYSGGSPVPPSMPYTASSAPGGAAGSFLRSAAATAAGVVGGQLIYDGLRHMFGGSSFAPGMEGGFFASPPAVTNISEQSSPGGDRSSAISGDGPWEEDDSSTEDSVDNDDSVAGGGDFDTDDEDSGAYDHGDAF